MIQEAGYLLVAEGIESNKLAKQVKKIGFNFGQGYLFGRAETPPKVF